jgi:dsRNA-specific ribonuclease
MRYLRQNPSEQGEWTRTTLASTVEAFLGAVWIDSHKNMETVQKLVNKLTE